MSATVRTPLVPGPVQGPTREEPQLEALLLDDYSSLVHLAYLILPPSVSRQRRVNAAHTVVQSALPPRVTLPTSDPREFMRHRVVQEATRQASQRSALARLSGVLARADELGASSRAPGTSTTPRSGAAPSAAGGDRLHCAAHPRDPAGLADVLTPR